MLKINKSAAVEVTDILDAVLHHCKSGKTETECKACVLVGINAALSEYVRVNHSAGAKLKPAAVLTGRASLTAADKAVDVKLKARLNEREEADEDEL